MPGYRGASGKPQINDKRASMLHLRAFLESQEKALRLRLVCYTAEYFN